MITITNAQQKTLEALCEGMLILLSKMSVDELYKNPKALEPQLDAFKANLESLAEIIVPKEGEKISEYRAVAAEKLECVKGYKKLYSEDMRDKLALVHGLLQTSEQKNTRYSLDVADKSDRLLMLLNAFDSAISKFGTLQTNKVENASSAETDGETLGQAAEEFFESLTQDDTIKNSNILESRQLVKAKFKKLENKLEYEHKGMESPVECLKKIKERLELVSHEVRPEFADVRVYFESLAASIDNKISDLNNQPTMKKLADSFLECKEELANLIISEAKKSSRLDIKKYDFTAGSVDKFVSSPSITGSGTDLKNGGSLFAYIQQYRIVDGMYKTSVNQAIKSNDRLVSIKQTLNDEDNKKTLKQYPNKPISKLRKILEVLLPDPILSIFFKPAKINAAANIVKNAEEYLRAVPNP